jgi:nitrite reductase/ring-hydroxylating ferredoxin subunit
VDDKYLARFLERSAFESARTGPPEGFPKLRDLPLGRYTDPLFRQLEDQYLFKRTWLYAAHDSDLPTPGSYKLCDIAGAPILLARDEDSVVRGFYNACRHRGAPVVRGECGTARRLTCQFHSWSYNLAGELVHVPDERDFIELDKSERGLPPVRCEAWGGWHFVNLDLGAEPLLDFLDPVPRLLPEVATAPFRVIDVKNVDLGCNWKILAEAFLEVYHARTIHPKTLGPTMDTRGTVISLYDHGHQSMLSPVNRGARSDNRDCVCRTFPSTCRTASPAAWPWVSLIDLNLSMSSMSSEYAVPCLSCMVCTAATCSSNARRLGSRVNGSMRASSSATLSRAACSSMTCWAAASLCSSRSLVSSTLCNDSQVEC